MSADVNGSVAVLVEALVRDLATPRRLALNPEEAAAALGVSRDFFDERVKGELRVVRVGRKVLVPIAELEKWSDRSAAITLGSGR